MMKKKSIWKDPYLYLCVLVNVAIHHVWFFSMSILTHGDAGYNFPQQLGQVASFQTWSSAGLGSITAMPSSYPYIYLAGFLARAGLSSAAIQRIILFWPAVIVGSIGSYLLVKKISGSGLGGLVGSFVFNLNTFFIISTSGHITIAAAIAWFPLTFYLFMGLTEKPSLKRAVGCAIPLFIISLLEFRVFYVCCLPLVLYYLFSVAEKRRTRKASVFTGLFFLPLLLTILLNSYWLIPYYMGGLEGGLEGVIVGRAVFTGGISGTNLLQNAFTIFAPMWSGGKLVTFSVHPIPYYWFLVPLAAFSALFFKKLRCDMRVLFFALIALIGIFLTKFIFPPFSGAYEWLYMHFPGFNAFREPSKFTFLIYLPYAVLIGCLVGHLQKRASGRQWRTIAAFVAAALVSLPFLFNAVPVASGSAGALFVGRDLPHDYEVFENFILDQPGFFRTLWVPTYSRWSYFDDQHPIISCVDEIQKDWKELQPPERNDIFKPENIVNIMQRPFSEELLRGSSVKYVVVPLQDIENDDDFFAYYGGDRQFFIDQLDGLEYLERLDIGTSELAVYRTREYRQEAFATNDVCRLDAVGDIGPQYLLAKWLNGGDLPFSLNEDIPGGIRIEDLLASEEEDDITSGDRTMQVPAVEAGETRTLYADRGQGELRCLLSQGRVVLKRLDLGLLLQDGQVIDGSLEGAEILRTVRVDPDAEWWLEADGVWIRLENDKEVNLGNMGRIENLRLFRAEGENLIPNGSFEAGLWEEEASTLSDGELEPNPVVKLSEEEANDGRYSLQLEADRGVVGTHTSFTVEGDQEYRLSLDYQSPDAEIAGYSLHFNDEHETIISKQLPVPGPGWIGYRRGLKTPPGATVATLYLYAYGDEGQGHVVNRYDNCELRRLDYTDTLGMSEFRSRFQEVALQGQNKDLDLEFMARESSGLNLISNPSFEEGLWGDKATDCDEYDDNPVLGMALDDEQATDGHNSLRLEATRHIAGAYTVFPVQENQDYYLSFDYQSFNSKEAGFSLHFNDEAETIISERLPIEGAEWQEHRQVVSTPLGASLGVLYVYAYESDGFTNMVNSYDDFRFFKITPGTGSYYLVEREEVEAEEPVVTEISDCGPTNKKIEVRSGTEPYVLILSQAYNSGWTVTGAGEEDAGGMAGRVLPQRWKMGGDATEEGSHFQVDGNLNAWYLAPRSINTGAEDSLEYPLGLEFSPQKKARQGSIISWLVGLAMLAFAVYAVFKAGIVWLMKLRQRKKAAR